MTTGNRETEARDQGQPAELVISSDPEERNGFARPGDVDAMPEVIEVRPAPDGTWAVFTVRKANQGHATEPCPRCPWRKDAPLGAFPPEVFTASARTNYDMAQHTFGCHGSKRCDPLTCAGFLLVGAGNNRAVRVAIIRGTIDLAKVGSSVELYSSYREMAIANGVDPDDPALERCRDDGLYVITPGSPGDQVCQVMDVQADQALELRLLLRMVRLRCWSQHQQRSVHAPPAPRLGAVSHTQEGPSMRSTEHGVVLIDERHEEYEDDLGAVEHSDGRVSVLAEVHPGEGLCPLDMVQAFMRTRQPGVVVDACLTDLVCYHGERLVELTYRPAGSFTDVALPSPRAENDQLINFTSEGIAL